MPARFSTRISLYSATAPVVAWLGAVLSLGCAVPPTASTVGPAPIQVFGRSHNRSQVDVYLLCGDRDARWLGAIGGRETAAFKIPAESARCLQGLNFFLVVRKSGRGYWAGPVRPRAGGTVDLLVERYAGLSAARLYGDSR